MGIPSLFSCLKPAKDAVCANDLKGKTIGIDTSCLIHRYVLKCAYSLLTVGHSDIYANDVLKYAQDLQRNGAVPIFIFDGRKLPLKEPTDALRSSKRQEARSGLIGWNSQKKKMFSDANKLCGAVEVTPEMHFKVRSVLKENGFRCIVAPYEADGQLAIGCRLGYWWAVMSEDSDILVMGATRLICKFRNGAGDLYHYKDVLEAITSKGGVLEKGMPMDCEWGGSLLPAHFTLGCILAGCDYAPSLSGIGIRRAFKFVKDSRGSITRLLRLLRLEAYTVRTGYEEELSHALWGFHTQLAINPDSHELIVSYPNNDWTESPDGFNYEVVYPSPGEGNLYEILPQMLKRYENDGIASPWKEYLTLTTRPEGVDYRSISRKLGLCDPDNSSIPTDRPFLDLLREFSRDGSMHPATLLPFKAINDEGFKDHPIILPNKSDTTLIETTSGRINDQNKEPKAKQVRISGRRPIKQYEPTQAGGLTIADYFELSKRSGVAPQKAESQPSSVEFMSSRPGSANKENSVLDEEGLAQSDLKIVPLSLTNLSAHNRLMKQQFPDIYSKKEVMILTLLTKCQEAVPPSNLHLDGDAAVIRDKVSAKNGGLQLNAAMSPFSLNSLNTPGAFDRSQSSANPLLAAKTPSFLDSKMLEQFTDQLESGKGNLSSKGLDSAIRSKQMFTGGGPSYELHVPAITPTRDNEEIQAVSPVIMSAQTSIPNYKRDHYLLFSAPNTFTDININKNERTWDMTADSAPIKRQRRMLLPQKIGINDRPFSKYDSNRKPPPAIISTPSSSLINVLKGRIDGLPSGEGNDGQHRNLFKTNCSLNSGQKIRNNVSHLKLFSASARNTHVKSSATPGVMMTPIDSMTEGGTRGSGGPNLQDWLYNDQ